MMMPFEMHYPNLTLPDNLNHYKDLVHKMLRCVPKHVDNYVSSICYLTIDEREVKAGEVQRNPGLHVDGMFNGETGGAWSGSGGSWGSLGNGMLLANNIDDTFIIHTGEFEGYPIDDGNCEHLRDQLDNINIETTLVKKQDIIWADGMLVHESLPVKEDCKRQFIRISLPNSGPWFEDYTKNPLGIKPTGDILPPRLKEQEELYNDN
jgi:hypothetical protein